MKLTTKGRSKIEWRLGSCSSPTNLHFNKVYQQKCCITEEEATLICKTRDLVNGWGGGKLEFYGHTFCDVLHRTLMIKLNITGSNTWPSYLINLIYCHMILILL